MYFFIIFLINTKSVTSVQFGSVFESIPYTRSFSVTNLGLYIKKTFDEGCLNAPVDVLYLDVTTRLNCENFLDDVITDETLVILKIKQPNDTNVPALPKLKGKNVLKFGDWDNEHTAESNYFLVFI